MNKLRLSVLTANYMYMAGVGILSPIYALFVRDIGGSAFVASASWSLYLILAGIIMIATTNHSRPEQYKRNLLLGYSIAALSTFLYIVVWDVASLLMLQVIHAIGIGILTPTLRAVYARVVSTQRETRQWAVFDGGLFILQGIAALIGGTLLTLYGFVALFVFMGVTQLVSVGIIARSRFDFQTNR